MTPEEFETLDKVLKRYAYKFVFGPYDKDDLYQEGFIKGMEAIAKYDGKSKLETYLISCIKNHLIVFKRDNYSRPSDACNNCEAFDANCKSCLKRQSTYLAKRNLLVPLDISLVSSNQEEAILDKVDYVEDIETAELLKLIDSRLPVKYREDYLKMREGMYVNKAIRKEIEEIVRDIING